LTTRILRDEADRQAWVTLLCARDLPLTVSAIKGADRTAQQNRLSHKWYAQIGDEFGELAATVKARCKYRFGLPIMIRDNPAWVAKWSGLYAPILRDGTAEQKALAFEAVPMTSQFTSRQMSEYMDAVQICYRAQGVQLIDPEARKYGD